MAAEASILARTPLAIKIVLVILIVALAAATTVLMSPKLLQRCPSYIWKDPQTRQCFYVYLDGQGHEVRQPLASCPAGC
jgi:hypothetical protein